jgi:hypothetical protein
MQDKQDVILVTWHIFLVLILDILPFLKHLVLLYFTFI